MVIWHKTPSPLHTDGSVVFARLQQCASHSVHHNRFCPPPCWITLSISIAGYVWACSGLAFLRPQIFPSRVGIWTPSNPKRHLDRFSRSWPTDRQTDRQTDSYNCADHATLSVTIDRIYLVLRCGLQVVMWTRSCPFCRLLIIPWLLPVCTSNFRLPVASISKRNLQRIAWLLQLSLSSFCHKLASICDGQFLYCSIDNLQKNDNGNNLQRNGVTQGHLKLYRQWSQV